MVRRSWGGRRPGAGRKFSGMANEDRKIATSVGLTADVVAFLDCQGGEVDKSRSALIESFVRERPEFHRWESQKKVRKKLDEGVTG